MLSFFSQVNRDISEELLLEKYQNSWKEHPENTIKILYHLRDIRNGKGEKHVSHIIFRFIKNNNPELYKSMFPDIVQYGSWKDFLMITDKFNKDELDFFTNQLNSDLFSETPSLCAKWAPSEGSHFSSVAKQLMKNMELNPKDYRQLLTTIRKKINMVESLMSQKEFGKIEFEKVPSKCHKNNRKAFNRTTNSKKIEDPSRNVLVSNYEVYLEKLKNKETKINFKGIQPHELVKTYLKDGSEEDPVIETQWKSIVDDLKKTGTFKNSIAISDVSGSMSGEPLCVSIALGILISEFCDNQVISFSDSPKIHNLSCSRLLGTDSLHRKVKYMKRMDWKQSTNMTAVFQLLLDSALKNKVDNSEMFKTIFILTDMCFNDALAISSKKLDYFKNIRELYRKHGYDMPNIVLWNLRAEMMEMPISKNDEGFILMSGFSNELLKGIIKYGVITPEKYLECILSEYELRQEVKALLNNDSIDRLI